MLRWTDDLRLVSLSVCLCACVAAFGPVFHKGDVIGCGYVYSTQTVFFTRNSQLVGTPFTAPPAGFYPTLGFRSVGESVKVNFGKEPFAFNVLKFVQEQK